MTQENCLDLESSFVAHDLGMSLPERYEIEDHTFNGQEPGYFVIRNVRRTVARWRLVALDSDDVSCRSLLLVPLMTAETVLISGVNRRMSTAALDAVRQALPGWQISCPDLEN